MAARAIESQPALQAQQLRRRRTNVLRTALLTPASLLMLGLYGYALIIFMTYSFYHYDQGVLNETPTLQAWQDFITDPYYLQVLRTTLELALTVTFYCLLIGYPLAYFLNRLKSNSLKQWFAILIFAPLLVSVVVRAYGWQILLGRSGLINFTLLQTGLIDSPIRLSENFTGVVIATVHVLLAFACFPILSVLAQIDPTLKEAAADLGASRWQTFWRVTFPLSIPGLIAAAQLVLPLVLSAFITPAMLGGGRVTVLSQVIYRSTLNLNWPSAAVAGAFLVLLTMVGLMIFEGLARRFFASAQLG